jgi:hypothetical protein
MLSPRPLLRSLAGLTVLGATAYWWFAGAHRGWSMHRVPVPAVDEITGLEYVLYEDRFVPGVEYLAGAVVVALLLHGLSFLFRSTYQPS